MIKRYQFFSHALCAEGGQEGGRGDIIGEADSLEEGVQVLVKYNLLNGYGNVFYWLDLEQRCWSTQEEITEFLEKHAVVYQKNKPPQLYRNFTHGAPPNRASGWPLPITLFNLFYSDDYGQPDTRTEQQKRADFLRGCHIKYTK